MKLYTMECMYDPETAENPFSPGIIGQKEYFVKLETLAERNAYTSVDWGNKDLSSLWQAMLNSIATTKCITEEDVYHYITPDVPELEVGGTYEDADCLVWERVA